MRVYRFVQQNFVSICLLIGMATVAAMAYGAPDLVSVVVYAPLAALALLMAICDERPDARVVGLGAFLVYIAILALRFIV